MKAKSNSRPVASGSGLSYTQKISLAAGSLSALALLPAQAGIVHVSGSPVSLAMSAANGASVNWDVDGANGADFQLFRYNYTPYSSIIFASLANGQGVVGVGSDDVQPLAQSFNVGPTLAAYGWNAAGNTSMNAIVGSSPNFSVGYDFSYQGFVAGDNYFGFRFLSGVNLLYGWAIINFDLTAGSEAVTIKEWAYNDTDDTPIHIADTGPSKCRNPPPQP